MEASSWDYGPLRSFDPDGDGGWLAGWQCGIQTWTWGLYSFETGSPISGYQYTENTSPEPPGDGWLDGEHTFHITSPGQYWLMLKVVDTDWYEGGPGNLDDYSFYRLGVFDLGILGSSYVQLNNDDDNVSGIVDCADAEAPLAGENDLMPVCLWFAPAPFPGEVELKVPDGYAGCIRVWEDSDKTGLILPRSGVPDYEKWKIKWGVPTEPKTVYVEAIGKPGNSEQKTWLVWNYVINGNEYVSKGVESITPVVLEVDMDIAGVKDDDYYWPDITEETTPGALIPLGDVVKIERLKVLPENETVVPVNMSYPVILSAPAGSSKIRVWADQQKTVPVTLPAVYFSRATVPSELWVEGYEVSDSVRDITLRWWWNGFVDEIKATVLELDEVCLSSGNAITSPVCFEGGRYELGNPCEYGGEASLIIPHCNIRSASDPSVIRDFTVGAEAIFSPVLTISDLPVDLRDVEKWSKVAGPASGYLDDVTELNAKYKNPKKGGVYEIEFEVPGWDWTRTKSLLHLPLAGPCAETWVESEMVELCNVAATIGGMELESGTICYMATSASMDWEGEANQSGWSPCHVFGTNETVTIHGVVVSDPKFQNMMWGFFSRLFYPGVDWWVQVLLANFVGTPDTPECWQAYMAGKEWCDGDSLETVIQRRGFAMQLSGSIEEKLWPSEDPYLGGRRSPPFFGMDESDLIIYSYTVLGIPLE